MINRNKYRIRLEAGLKRSPVVALLGARQVGKTTLARQIADGRAGSVFFDLEDPVVAALMEEPMSALSPLRGLVVLDEVQRQPKIFPVLRVLADRENTPARFLILGSASPELSRQASESLAGRVETIEMDGFDLSETGKERLEELWVKGGFPRSYLAQTDEDSFRWRRDFIRTFLERDLGMLGFGMAPAAMGRFWTLLSHYHAQIWNGSEAAVALGIAPNTARSYLDALEQTYMIRKLLPWHVNVGKRLVKSPKIYFRDSGIFHALQGISSMTGLLTNPKLGASWEGFALEQVLTALRPFDVYFYAVHSGAELDLFLPTVGRRLGVEFKRQDAPKITHSMRVAREDLQLDELWIVYPGLREYTPEPGFVVKPLASLKSEAESQL
jgi:predicted AAA+ superfamily ATPase